MPTIRDGHSSLLKAVHTLDRLYRKYGAGPLVNYTGVDDFADALSILHNLYQGYRAGDNWPGEVEEFIPDGPEDS